MGSGRTIHSSLASPFGTRRLNMPTARPRKGCRWSWRVVWRTGNTKPRMAPSVKSSTLSPAAHSSLKSTRGHPRNNTRMSQAETSQTKRRNQNMTGLETLRKELEGFGHDVSLAVGADGNLDIKTLSTVGAPHDVPLRSE